MPHIWLKNPIIDAIKSERVTFCGINEHNDTLIAINFDGLEFALSLKQKNEKWLLKYDKPSRPSDTKILKDALRFVAKELNGEILSDNTAGNKSYALQGLIEPNSFDAEQFLNKSVFAEIGFGSGVHLQNLAANNPQNSYIGVEIYKPAIYKFLNRCALDGIKNAYAIDEDARVFFETLPYSFLDGLYVHFPVPWPDAPHRRVWSMEFVEAAIKVVKDRGFIHLRTDDKEYFEFAKEVVNELGLSYEFAINEPLEVVSKYEARWQRQNKDIYDLVIINSISVNCEKKAYNFAFENLPILDKTVVRDGILVSSKSPYIAKNGDQICKVAFGATNRPKIYYIKFKNNKAFYWPKEPLHSVSNAKAHEILKEHIGSINSSARA
ncbi:MAG: tRNA m7G46 methyltransferase [Pseudomonadota bacterium]